MLCYFLLHKEVNQSYVYMYLLPLEPPSHSTLSSPSPRSSQSTKLRSLCYTAASRKFSILHMVVCICQSQSPSLSHLPRLVYVSVCYVCISIPALKKSSCIHFTRFHIYVLLYDDPILTIIVAE